MGATGTNINNTSIRDTLRSMQFDSDGIYKQTTGGKLTRNGGSLYGATDNGYSVRITVNRGTPRDVAERLGIKTSDPSIAVNEYDFKTDARTYTYHMIEDLDKVKKYAREQLKNR